MSLNGNEKASLRANIDFRSKGENEEMFVCMGVHLFAPNVLDSKDAITHPKQRFSYMSNLLVPSPRFPLCQVHPFLITGNLNSTPIRNVTLVGHEKSEVLCTNTTGLPQGPTTIDILRT